MSGAESHSKFSIWDPLLLSTYRTAHTFIICKYQIDSEKLMLVGLSVLLCGEEMEDGLKE